MNLVIVSISSILAVSSLAAAEVELPIQGDFSHSGISPGLPDGWTMNHAFPGRIQIIEGNDVSGGGNAVEVALSEHQEAEGKWVGMTCTSYFPFRAGDREYEYRFQVRGNGKILLGFSLWGDGGWIALKAAQQTVSSDDWEEHSLPIRVPENAFMSASKEEDGGEPVPVSRIQPVIFVTSGSVQIANLKLIADE
ncbi:MAG TPA: hypothetical protein VNQ90_13905 [Chthoniobacteraceae bacterium]|nr:hypothetical protein [Chthoniobacteraceae bacterium]